MFKSRNLSFTGFPILYPVDYLFFSISLASFLKSSVLFYMIKFLFAGATDLISSGAQVSPPPAYLNLESEMGKSYKKIIRNLQFSNSSCMLSFGAEVGADCARHILPRCLGLPT